MSRPLQNITNYASSTASSTLHKRKDPPSKMDNDPKRFKSDLPQALFNPDVSMNSSFASIEGTDRKVVERRSFYLNKPQRTVTTDKQALSRGCAGFGKPSTSANTGNPLKRSNTVPSGKQSSYIFLKG